ncbi:MAG TPA: amidohydrolase family protein [Allosphingosinicella sp.]|nr:amidohydrolase family protein [Allosphingosinicella sp.]
MHNDLTGSGEARAPSRPDARLARFAWLLILALGGLLAASPATAQGTDAPPEGNSFVIRDVRVFDGGRAIERANVVVRDGRVASVGRRRPPAGLPVVDGAGRTLLPGLIDAHAHVQNATSLQNAARFGVTTALDMLTRVEVVRAHRGQRDRLDRTALADLWSSGTPATSPRGLGTQFGIPFLPISGAEEAGAFVRARIAEGSDYIKILYEPSVPFFTTISPETLRALIVAAHAEGVRAVVHVSSLEGARGAVAAGADGLAHVFSDAVIDDALARDMASRGMFVTSTLSIIAAFHGEGLGAALAADPRVSPWLTDAQRRGLMSPAPGPDYPLTPYLTRFDLARASENIRRLHAAGVRILAGTDAPNLGSHGITLHGELQLLTQAGLSPAEALRAATLGPAQVYGLDDRGRIAAGARADLVLVEGNPLRDIGSTRAIVRVFKNGFAVERAAPAAPPASPAAAN